MQRRKIMLQFSVSVYEMCMCVCVLVCFAQTETVYIICATFSTFWFLLRILLLVNWKNHFATQNIGATMTDTHNHTTERLVPFRKFIIF